ncbi:MAG: hypothetical protein NTX16_04195 [Actinobacteria bacterium]|nr:hypothetical protein [Actinomycetota bacterium]
MVLMLEEIVVEFVAIAAPLVALACLIYLLVLIVLERRELRRLEAARRCEWESGRSTQWRRHADASASAMAPGVRAHP